MSDLVFEAINIRTLICKNILTVYKKIFHFGKNFRCSVKFGQRRIHTDISNTFTKLDTARN